jgi:hypothetical protein
MAKAVRFFSGTIPIECHADWEAAVREDGAVFMRGWSHGRYKSWTRWWSVSTPPVGLDEQTEVRSVRLPDYDGVTAPDLTVVKM